MPDPTLHSQAIERLRQAGCDSPRYDARALWQAASHDSQKFEALLQRRIKREPLSQILGSKPFWKHDFLVSADVLTPRADSELLIEQALKCLADKNTSYRFADLGTGSGCLILSLLDEYSNAQGVAVDISSKALNIAQQNAKQLNLAHRVEFIESNWLEGLTGAFDLVISNPPYIPKADAKQLMPEVQLYEPSAALIGGIDGLDAYHHIAGNISSHLKPRGWLLFEIGINQSEEVAEICRQYGFNVNRVCKDLSGIERAIIAQKQD